MDDQFDTDAIIAKVEQRKEISPEESRYMAQLAIAETDDRVSVLFAGDSLNGQSMVFWSVGEVIHDGYMSREDFETPVYTHMIIDEDNAFQGHVYPGKLEILERFIADEHENNYYASWRMIGLIQHDA